MQPRCSWCWLAFVSPFICLPAVVNMSNFVGFVWLRVPLFVSLWWVPAPVLLPKVVAYGLLVFGSPLKFMSQSGCWPFVPNYLVGWVRGFWFASICLPNSPLACLLVFVRLWNFCSYVTCVFVVKDHLFSFLSLAFLLFSLPV